MASKHVTSNGEYRRGLAPGQHIEHSSEETLRRRRAVYDTVPNLTSLRIEPLTSHAHSDVFNHFAKILVCPVFTFLSRYNSFSQH